MRTLTTSFVNYAVIAVRAIPTVHTTQGTHAAIPKTSAHFVHTRVQQYFIWSLETGTETLSFRVPNPKLRPRLSLTQSQYQDKTETETVTEIKTKLIWLLHPMMCVCLSLTISNQSYC